MPLLIDTWNVLHITGVLPPSLAGMGLADFVDLLQISRYQNRRITLVCDGVTADGASASAPGSTIRIRFSGPIRTADEVIIAAVNKSTAPRQLLVISSDREIRRAARRRKASILTSEEFLSHLVLDHQAAVPLPPPISLPPAATLLPADVLAEAEALTPPANDPVPASDPASCPPVSTPPAPPPPSPPPETKRSPKVEIPRDILAEAAAMESADRADRADRKALVPPSPPPPADPPEARRNETSRPEPSNHPPNNPPLLPPEMIQDALELESAARTARRPSPPTPPTSPTPKPSQPPTHTPAANPLLPPDLLREALEMERTSDPESPGNSDRRKTPRPPSPPPSRAGGFIFPETIVDEAEDLDEDLNDA